MNAHMRLWDLLGQIAVMGLVFVAAAHAWNTPVRHLAPELIRIRPILWNALLGLTILEWFIKMWNEDRWRSSEQLRYENLQQARELQGWRERYPKDTWYQSAGDRVQRAIEEVIEASKTSGDKPA